MKIRTQVSLKQYAKLLFGLTYQRPIMKLILGVALLLILWITFYYAGYFDLPPLFISTSQ